MAMAEADKTPPKSARTRRSRGSTLPDSPNAIEIAMDAMAAEGQLSSPAHDLLISQNRLIHAQLTEAKLRHWVERLTLASRLFLAILAAAPVRLVILLVVSAARPRGLIVEPIRTPPDLAQRGLDGNVLSARLLDKLAAMQAETDSARSPDSYQNDWGKDLKIEFAGSGISLGQLDRWLRSKLGKETRISGELWRDAGRMMLNVRGGAEAGNTVSGSEADLDAMLQQAAESIYERTQPYRYGVYLLNNVDRDQQGAAIFTRLRASPDKTDAAWANVGLSNYYQQQGKPQDAIPALRRAIAIQPDMVIAWMNMPLVLSQLGDDEGSYRASVRLKKIMQDPVPGISRRASDMLRPYSDAWEAIQIADYPRAIASFGKTSELQDYSGIRRYAQMAMASALAAEHKPSAAAELLANIGYANDAESLAVFRYLGATTTPGWDTAAARGDWAAAFAQLDAASRPTAELPRDSVTPFRQVLLEPRLALAEAEMGRLASANERIERTSLRCYFCVRVRARVAHLSGQFVATDGWYRAATRLSPSLPFAPLEWGVSQLARGDSAAATTLCAEASSRSPTWADPLKCLGDALQMQRQFSAAIEKYEEAAERTPRWGALQIEWGKALWRSGKREDAREKFRAAATMDLSSADRAHLRKLWTVAIGQA